MNLPALFARLPLLRRFVEPYGYEHPHAYGGHWRQAAFWQKGITLHEIRAEASRLGIRWSHVRVLWRWKQKPLTDDELRRKMRAALYKTKFQPPSESADDAAQTQ